MNETYNLSIHSSNTPTATPSVMADSDRLHYKIYSDFSEIKALSQQWENLVATSQWNKVFASLEWYLANYDPTAEPYVIVATRGSEMTCILPLLLDREAGFAIFPEYGNDYNDVLVRDSNPALVADLLRYAISVESPCRHLRLSRLRPDSNCLAALSLLKDDPGIECRYSDCGVCFYAELPCTFEDYLASLGQKFRRKIRRAFRDATAGGLTICELYPRNLDPVELADIYFRLLMCRHSDQELDEQIEAQSFVKEILPIIFQKRSMRVFAVMEQGRIIAVLLTFVAGNGLLAWGSGFLTGCECWSPGTMLIAFAIQQAIEAGLREFDFGTGTEAYKKHWTNREYTVTEVDLVSKR